MADETSSGDDVPVEVSDLTDSSSPRSGTPDPLADSAGSKLRAVASLPRLEHWRPGLLRLAEATESDESALRERWHSVDLRGMFPASEIEPVADESPRLSRLEALRVPAVFLPVLFTWFGVWRASGAYDAMLTGQANQTRPFIDLWRDGFGDRTWFTLERVALGDFVLIALAVGLALLTVLMRTASDNRFGQEIDQVRKQLDEALIAATINLRRDTIASTDAVRRHFVEAVSSLSQLGHAVDAASQIGESVEGLREVTTHFGSSTDQLVTLIDQLQQQAGTLSTGVERVASGSETVISQMSGALTGLADSSRTFGSASDGMRTLASELQESQRSFTTAMADSASAASTMASTLGSAADRLASVESSTGELTRGMQGATESSRDMSMAIGTALEVLRQTLAEQEAASKVLRRNHELVASTTALLQDGVQNLLDSAERAR